MSTSHTPSLPPLIRVVAGAWVREGRVLAALRPADKHMGDLWELPGGKVEPGESDERALERELMEELGARVKVGRLVAQREVAHGGRAVLLVAYVVHGTDEPRCLEHQALRWLGPDEFASVAWAPADREIIELVPLESSC